MPYLKPDALDRAIEIAQTVLTDDTEAELLGILEGAKKNQADPALIEAARDEHANDECEIDDDAATSESDEGTWVQAWVWVPKPDEEDEDHDEADPERTALELKTGFREEDFA